MEAKMNNNIKTVIESGKTALGIEFGSTRIKLVLIDDRGNILASGNHTWENQLENGIWTYALNDVWSGLRDGYRKLSDKVKELTGADLATVGSIGISAMMHGYLAFDKADNQIAEFKTWRNTVTGEAAKELTELFSFNIPQRWSVAHLYQAILNHEKDVNQVAFFTTLSGYVHWKLAGQKVLGVGDASGMFPVDSNTNDYNQNMVNSFDRLTAGYGFPHKLAELLPTAKVAGERAGNLTGEGARLIDPSGNLQSGIPLCPPEGDIQTGMVATNSVKPCTGNISAGTSINAVIVLDKNISGVYPEIDITNTPSGKPSALIHGNNCSSDIDAWAGVFLEAAKTVGADADLGKMLDNIFFKALEGEADCGGLLYYNYLSGETIVNLNEGRPLFIRQPNAHFNFANFARTQLYSAIAVLRIGMDILRKNENVKLTSLVGHGGYFKAKGVGQRMTACALNTPVKVMETAGEGGAWGIALLALYMLDKSDDKSLGAFLDDYIFCHQREQTVLPGEADIKGFEQYLELYIKGLAAEKAAIHSLVCRPYDGA
jgi:sugar (pentulose or hexulose) kinase